MALIGPVLVGLASALTIGAIALLAAGLLGRRAESSTAGHWGPALALGAGYVAGHVAIARPSFPPVEVTDRIPWLALVATVLGLLEAARPGPGWTRWENRLLLTALVLGAVLGPVLGGEPIEGRILVLWLTGLGLAMLAGWTNLEALAGRTPARVLGPALLAVSAGAAGVLALSGSVILGQLAGCLTVALAAVWMTSWWSPRPSFARGAVPVLAAGLGSLLLVGYTYASLPSASAGLVAAAPAAAWAGRVGPLRRRAPWASALVALVAVLVPLGVSVALAVSASPAYEY